MIERPRHPAAHDTTLTGEHPVLPQGHILGGRYRIESLAGLGGMGMVYRAHDLELDQVVALKLLHPQRALDEATPQRFRRELILARQVSHPNVVRIHDIGHDAGTYFLTMDYVDGRSLREWLDADGPRPLDEAVSIAAQLAEALSAAHAKNIVHRDLKPSNILIDAENRALITDFGIARSIEEVGLTRTGHVIGTPDYLAPEQAHGAKVDARTDLYALGVILYEMLSGSLPFSGESLAEKLAQHATGRARDISTTGMRVPPWLRQVLRRCLAPAPQQRYQTAAELAADLRAQHFRARPLREVSWGRAAAGVLVAGVAALAGYLFWERGGTVFTAAGPSAQHAVAVLPFQDQTGSSELTWLDNGIPDMLTAQLAENSELKVVDSWRVMRTLRDLNTDIAALDLNDVRQLAELLDVDRLIVGSVRRGNGQLHISARMLGADAAEDIRYFNVSGAAEGTLADTTRILVREIVSTLGTDPHDTAPVSLSGVPEAMQAYVAGMDKLLIGDSVSAMPLLEQAVAADSGFAAAWLRLAGAYEASGYYDRAATAAQRAVQEAGSPQSRIAFEARARAAALTGDFARAEELLQALLQSYPHDTATRMALAKTFGDAGEYKRATAVLHEVTRADPSHPLAWYLLGKYAILQGDSRRAVDEYLVRALVIQNRLGNAQGRADVLNAMGIAYHDLGKFDAAKERYMQSVATRREIGDQHGVATALTNLARLDALRGEYAAAREELEEAMRVLEQLGDRAGVANLRNEFGVLEEEQGRYAQALEHFRAALRIRQDLGDQRALAESYNNIGYVYYLLGEYDNAHIYANQSLTLYRQTENREGEMLATQTVGQLEIARGNWDAALKAFLASLQAARELDYPDAAAVAQGAMGRIALYQGRYGAAAGAYSEAFTAVEQIDDLRGMIEFTLFQAELYAQLHMYEQMRAALDNAQAWLARGGNEAQRAELHRLRSVLSRYDGDAARAADYAERAVESARQSGSLVVLLAAELNAADSAAALSDVRATADRLGHEIFRLKAREALAEMHIAAGDVAAAQRVLREALDIAQVHAPYHRQYRLHGLLARTLDAQGDTAAAVKAWTEAVREQARLRQHLDEAQREAFDALPVIIEIDKHAQASTG